jgi:E3 ubiquitin-protein ligase ZNF598
MLTMATQRVLILLLHRRYSALLARVSSAAPNPNGAIPAVKAAVRSYRANESAARDLISTIWNITDHSQEGTAGIINAVVEYLEEDDKKKDLLQAWNGFKIEV